MLDPSQPIPSQLAVQSGLQERLRQVIKQVGPNKLIALTGISRAQLNRYTNGTPMPSDRLAAIAIAGGVSLDWLIRGIEAQADSGRIDYTEFGEIIRLMFEVNSSRFNGHAWKPSELRYVIPLFLLNARHVARQGEPWKFDEHYILFSLCYLDGMRQPARLETYLQTLEMIATHPEISFEESWAGPFCATVNHALKHYYACEGSHTYYDRTHKGLGQHNLQWIRNFIDIYVEHRVGTGRVKLLDAGCGSGRYLSYLKANFDTLFEVHGLEQAPYALDLCRQGPKLSGINPGSVTEGDLLNMPYEDDSFGAVICYMVLHNFPNVKQSKLYGLGRALSEIYRVLAPEGMAHIVIPRDAPEEFLPVYATSHAPVTIFEILTQLGATIRDCTPFQRQPAIFPGNTIPFNMEAFYAVSFSKPLPKKP